MCATLPMTSTRWVGFSSRCGNGVHRFGLLDALSGKSLGGALRSYARPARFTISLRDVHRPPPPPVIPPSSIEDVREPDHVPDAQGSFDTFLNQTALGLFSPSATDFTTLYAQYRARAGTVVGHTIPYEERPARSRRADAHRTSPFADGADLGDGIVMVVYALFKTNGQLHKVCACSGFVVDAKSDQDRGESGHGDVVITCAHTLEEMSRLIKEDDADPQRAFSLVIPARGIPRRVTQILTSIPRSDVVAMEVEGKDASSSPLIGLPPLRTLPLSPFPVDVGSGLLTHLFSASPRPPAVQQSQSRLPPQAVLPSLRERNMLQRPVPWLQDRAWRRWGAGTMLGYRSYTGRDVEAGNHSSLPHILTSVLPTPGASGGPLVCGETGAVVGMISGRRMDNRVEGERGWGTSAEEIFEMFALPGFNPTGKK